MTFDIIKASKNITDKYVRYLKTMFDIDDSEYKELFDTKLKEMGSFSKGPYLEVIDSFASGSTVSNLIDEGLLSRDFELVDDIYHKTLYKHQEKAIRKLNEEKNIVVSTGTGSGKTESFLIPILNELMKEKENKSLGPGVRALLIYPMNALANDQIGRLRRLLKNYPDITFGAYTGQTLEDEDKALEKYKSLNEGELPLKNELISRSRMKEEPPNILITNYSMLEYLMLRPKDNSLFQGEYSNNWKYIVLDEAHTYTGSTGIEVSMLLRRLKGYLNNNKLKFVLTSATLGGEDSNEEVAEFATRLCSAPFYSDDVIRAERVNLSKNHILTTFTKENYAELRDIVDSGYSDAKILELLQDYFNENYECDDYSEFLYYALLNDETFWKIKEYLTIPRTTDDICKHLDWNNENITDFVTVASKAIYQRKKLFDARYHLFVRATDGVFITLGKNKDLSLSRKNIKYENDEQYKYFEIVTCAQCHSIYLLGNIEVDNGKKVLQQKSNLAGESIKEAFLLGDSLSDEDEDNKLVDNNLSTKEYELCPHCGFIRESNQVHKTSCEHSENDYVKLIKVSQSKRTGRVTKCLKCEGINNLGILRSFFTGQEASTSVIGTALFEELPDMESIIVHEEKDDDEYGFGFDNTTTNKEYFNKAKQFIAFSDNRQAAAFFATYFYETYQTFLYSRIINLNLKRLNGGTKDITSFVNDMSTDFRDNKVSELFDIHPDYEKEAWKAVLRELINSYSRNSLIGLGLMEVTFDDNVMIPENKKYGLTSEDVRNISLVLLRSLFEENAIHHGQNFTDSDREFFTNNNVTNSYAFSGSSNKFVKTFIPKMDTSKNKRIEYLERIFKAKGIELSREDIYKLMEGIWKAIFEKNEILKDNKDYSGKRVDISKFKVGRGSKWFKCSKCQRITPYNVFNVCPAYKCEGKLHEIDVDSLEKTNHYYRIYNDLEIKPLRVVEHTAQLSNEEAYKLQEMFKNQKIDVLSCSTTFEMGVDIGDLETVFMRNMPPTPSNYVQRAGRAGRSAKSAALALTFCNKSNHDFSFFDNPLSMIKGEINPPLFKTDNEKIGIRHLYSAAFSFFWRKNPIYFGSVYSFLGAEDETDGYCDFKNYLENKPDDLLEYLLKSFSSQLIDTFKIKTFGWVEWLFDNPYGEYPNFKVVYEEYRNEIEALFQEKVRVEQDNKSNSYIVNRIRTYTRENIISFLSRHNILPKYGFPVDTVELQLSQSKNGERISVDLSRDLSMAISEYAPGCEVVAAGRLIRSRYIKKMPNQNWKEYDYVQCQNCQTLNVTLHHEYLDTQSLTQCEQCGTEFDEKSIKVFLIPEFGFISENKIDKPTLIKPERTHRTEASLVGKGNIKYKAEYKIGKLKVKTNHMEDGEIAILNKSDFYVCESCGYSESNIENDKFSNSIKREHKKANGYKCTNNVLKKYSLGYRFRTDALHIGIEQIYTFEEAYSILQAIILSACSVLNIDNNEISGCVIYANSDIGNTFEFVIYDTTPGGAGHVKRFTNEKTISEVLKRAFDKANNCDCGGEEADTSCYKCLRTYGNQQHHDIIKRKYVINGLRKLF